MAAVPGRGSIHVKGAVVRTVAMTAAPIHVRG